MANEEIIKFTPNPELEKLLHTHPSVSEATDAAAEAIAERARELAPVDSGAYRDSIVAQKPSPKGVARVAATDPKAAWIEFGNSHEPARFVLRNAVSGLGLKFKKGK